MVPDKLAYRADIDGLRAVAVVLVVWFHAVPTSMPGGFIGVDVFFVISGFLITRIILADLKQRRFSFLQFYARRIRRIFPALVLVLATVLVLGWFLLLPTEYELLGRHVMAASVFLSNFQLLSESGYFDTGAYSKPLLNLWSLAIEEQYYIVWPALLWLLWRLRNWLAVVLVVMMLASFAGGLWTVASDRPAAFYLPHLRAWELMIGALVALIPDALLRDRLPSSVRNALAWLGAGLLVAGLLVISDAVAFPGWYALLPTLAAALLIVSGPSSWVARHILSQRLVVGIGLISYPLYLWHWPLLSLLVITQGADAGLGVRLMVVVVSFLLAWLTWRLVELPLRTRSSLPRTASGLLLAMLVVAGLAAVVWYDKGLPERGAIRSFLAASAQLSSPQPSADRSLCPQPYRDFSPPLKYCAQSSALAPTAAIVGDSHAAHIYDGLAAVDADRSWLLVGHNATPPVLGIQIDTPDPEQVDRQAQMDFITEALIADPDIRTVLLGVYGSTYLNLPGYAADHVALGFSPSQVKISSMQFTEQDQDVLFEKGLQAMVSRLHAAGKRVVLLMDVPELPFFPKDCIARPLAQSRHDCQLAVAAVNQRETGIREIYARISKALPDLQVYDPRRLICGEDVCDIKPGGELLYRDSHHLSAAGSQRLARDLLEYPGF